MHPGHMPQRLDPAPLLRVIDNIALTSSVKAVADQVGVDQRTLWKMRRQKTVTLRLADEILTKLDRHIDEVYL